ncbi:hypothetical protein [Actinoplanes palleronii]|uniref:Uncharacterized protein n=1 Tax=Actinoplanes palleronii TaxID=113570 RepID=A0ABQ4BKK8_9ACTN|nr:hypothetical protein [Actinoplanes palleronii]GIE70780.1 hypothetical protein Apa02nite_068880 [Actinoplanes palleronii]
MTNINPALRAHLDRELNGAIDGLLEKAALHDGKDIIEANVDLTNELLANLGLSQLAASAAALAIRLHRGGAA